VIIDTHMECRVAPLREFLRVDLDTCGVHLCKDGSEMQRELLEGASETPIAIVYDGIHPVAWCASHQWRGMQTLEGFTTCSFRRRGLQRFAASGLIAQRVVTIVDPVAVFSPDCVALTHSLGFRSVVLFLRQDGDWTEVNLK